MATAGEAGLLRGIADAMPAMIGYWNRDLLNEFANAAYVEYFGWTPEALRGVHIRDLLGPDLFARNFPYMERALAGQPQTFDRTLVDTSGCERHTQASYLPHVVDGDVRGFFVLVADTTQKVEAVRTAAESEAKFRLLAENATDVVCELDRDSLVAWMSPSSASVLGWRPEELLGTRPRTLVHPADEAELDARRHLVLAGAEVPPFELRIRCADETCKWMSVRARPVTVSGTVVGIIVGLRDVHEEVSARQALARSEQLFRLAMDGSPQPMAVVGITDRRWIQVNTRLCDLLGREPEWLLSHTVDDVLHPDDIDEYRTGARDLLAGAGDTMEAEHRLLRADGGVVWAAVSLSVLRDARGEPLFYVSHLKDVTEDRAWREHLTRLANEDELTGLSNRRTVKDRLADVLTAPRIKGVTGVLFCDLDGLKTINDSHGHLAGDHVIKHVAARITSAIRSSDVAARIGGDEFVVLAPGMPGPDAAKALAGKIHRAVSTPLQLADGDASAITPTISIGLVLARPGEDADALLKRADAALYAAKGRGRNQTATS